MGASRHQASVLAFLLGHIAAWGLVIYLLETKWSFDFGIAVAIVVGGTVAAMVWDSSGRGACWGRGRRRI